MKEPKFREKSKLKNHQEKKSLMESDVIKIRKLDNDANVIILKQLLKNLKCITKKIKEDQYDDQKIFQWKFAAKVIDRFCAVLFTLLTILSTIGVLFSSNNFFKFK